MPGISTGLTLQPSLVFSSVVLNLLRLRRWQSSIILSSGWLITLWALRSFLARPSLHRIDLCGYRQRSGLGYGFGNSGIAPQVLMIPIPNRDFTSSDRKQNQQHAHTQCNFLISCIIGCDGAQRGKFVVGSTGGISLEPSLAKMTFFRGTRNPIDGSAETLLLAVVVLAPGFESTGNKNEYSSATYVTSSKTVYEGPTGKIEASCKWNRETDLVTIDKKEFKRGDGNVFVLRIANPPDKESKCVQVPGIIDDKSASEILESVRKNLSNDKDSLQLVEDLRAPN